MDKINKLALPIAILIGCIILGGFYYASVVVQEKSAERQQQATLQAQEAQQQATLQVQQATQQQTTIENNLVASEKAGCVIAAQNIAISEYESSDTCTSTYPPSDCSDGVTYLVPQYDNAYTTCLESKGLQ